MKLLAAADALASLSGHRRHQVWEASALHAPPELLRDALHVTLPAYAVHNMQVEYVADMWKATLYADNLFDTFVRTGVRNTPAYNQVVSDDTGANVYQRGFFYSVLPPRRVGIRFERSF